MLLALLELLCRQSAEESWTLSIYKLGCLEATFVCLSIGLCCCPWPFNLIALRCRGETGVSASAQVANKVIELKMLHSGQEVCCQSDDDRARFERSQAEDSLQQ